MVCERRKIAERAHRILLGTKFHKAIALHLVGNSVSWDMHMYWGHTAPISRKIHALLTG
jgi:hypothetical protein